MTSQWKHSVSLNAHLTALNKGEVANQNAHYKIVALQPWTSSGKNMCFVIMSKDVSTCTKLLMSQIPNEGYWLIYSTKHAIIE